MSKKKSKRGDMIECPDCGGVKPLFGLGRCSNCYYAMREAEDADLKRRRRALTAASNERLAEQRRNPYRVGSWDDPRVRAHHAAMVQKYFGGAA